MYPKNSRFLKIDVNDKQQAQMLDALLDQETDLPVTINNVSTNANLFIVNSITFFNNIAYIIISPKINKEVINASL